MQTKSQKMYAASHPGEADMYHMTPSVTKTPVKKPTKRSKMMDKKYSAQFKKMYGVKPKIK